jgi:hypothetical protein
MADSYQRGLHQALRPGVGSPRIPNTDMFLRRGVTSLSLAAVTSLTGSPSVPLPLPPPGPVGSIISGLLVHAVTTTPFAGPTAPAPGTGAAGALAGALPAPAAAAMDESSDGARQGGGSGRSSRGLLRHFPQAGVMPWLLDGVLESHPHSFDGQVAALMEMGFQYVEGGNAEALADSVIWMTDESGDSDSDVEFVAPPPPRLASRCRWPGGFRRQWPRAGRRAAKLLETPRPTWSTW